MGKFLNKIVYKNMKERITAISVLVILLLSINVSAIEINPPILDVKGESGDFVLQSIEIYNDRDQETVVNISVAGINNYYLPKSTYVLKPYERKTITIGFTISGSANGFITYEYNGEVLTQIVSINSEKNVIIFPQNPKAGTSVAIITTSDEQANGFLFVSETGRQYPVILSGIPITFVNISKSDYGSAMIVLIWEDKEVTYHYINITKAKTTEEEKELSINFGGSKTIKYGDTRIITLKYGNEPVNGNFTIVKPDGNQILKDTNALGQITVTFNKAGTWTFIANYKDVTVSDTVTVKKSSVSVSVPDKVYVGDEVEIEISEDEGNFTIVTPENEYIDGNFKNGYIKFTPDNAGEYEITINCNGAEKTETFIAYYDPNIVFKRGFIEVYPSELKSGETYDVYVVDDNTGEIIREIQYISVIHKGQQEYITLINGVGKFIPKSGYYTLSINRDDKNYVDAYSTYITVYGSGSPSFPTGLVVGIVVIFLIAIVAVYAYKKGLIRRKPPALER